MFLIRSVTRHLTVAGLFFSLAAAQAADFNIEVTVTGLEVDKGQVIAALYNSEDTYMKTSAEQLISPLGADDTVVLTFKNQAPGEYAIAIVYDKNKDGKLDTGLFHIPTEKVGFSNDAPIRFGPPKWSAAKFPLTDADLKTEIDLKKHSKKDYSD
jgi:uncharacterized protein (DUF2141 family)